MTRTIPIPILIAILALFAGYAFAEIQPPPKVQPSSRLFQPETHSPDQFGNLEGRVLQTLTFTPIENAAVVLGTDTSWTDVHGDYLFQDIQAGTHEITASAFGHISETDTVEIISDSTIHWDFYLTRPIISVDIGGLPQGPPGAHIDYDFSLDNLGDGELIFNIEVIFENTNPWLEAIPDSGTVLPFSSEQIILSIDIPDTAQAGQMYFADVIIHNNSITPRITLPIVLTVIPASTNQDDINPLHFALCQNHPNPFNPSTNIHFDIPYNTHVKLSVYDILGHRITTLINSDIDAGNHSVTFDGSTLPSGIYFYRIDTNQFSETRKMILIK